MNWQELLVLAVMGWAVVGMPVFGVLSSTSKTSWKWHLTIACFCGPFAVAGVLGGIIGAIICNASLDE